MEMAPGADSRVCNSSICHTQQDTAPLVLLISASLSPNQLEEDLLGQY